MQDIQSLAQEIVATEGGYVNDPDDPGGATNFGVTLSTLKSVGYRGKFGKSVTTDDLRKLTKSEAADIFCKHYFFKPRLHELHPSLHAVLFDMSVNAGGNAVKILQTSANLVENTLVVDGVIGPKTIDYVNTLIKNRGFPMRDVYSIERREYYFRLGDKRPSLRKFARSRANSKGGWIMRAESFLSPKYHMTETEFHQRIAQWD